MFIPTKMRLYPLTRIVLPMPASTAPATAPATSSPATVPTLEARIELSDQFGDPCKGAGTVALELFDTSAPSLNRKPIASWTLSLLTPQENRDHWDRTTRTYLFKISLPADFSAPSTGHDRFQLSATFVSPGNASSPTRSRSRPNKIPANIPVLIPANQRRGVFAFATPPLQSPPDLPTAPRHSRGFLMPAPLQSVPLFLTQHAPVGAWASLSFGTPGKGICIQSQNAGTFAEADLLIALRRGAQTSAFPFVRSPSDYSDWQFLPTESITRGLSASTDEYACPNLTFRLFSPHAALPNPKRAGNLQFATAPGILI